jgi:hypothetical protein
MKLYILFQIDNEYGYDCYYGLFKTMDAMLNTVKKHSNSYPLKINEIEKTIQAGNDSFWFYGYEIINTDDLQ